MPLRKRTALERAEHRALLVGVARHLGRHFTPERACEVLNSHRQALARAQARLEGLAPEQVEAAAAAIHLLKPADVRHDFQVVLERLGKATVAAAAVWVDEQIEQCQEDMRLVDELILGATEDLRDIRSRGKSRTRAEIVPGAGDEEGGRRKAVPVEVITEDPQRQRAAPLISALVRLINQKASLRAEVRQLLSLKERVPIADGTATRRRLGARPRLAMELLKQGRRDGKGAVEAREGALQLYAAALDELAAGEEIRLFEVADVATVARERLRLAKSGLRFRMLGRLLEEVGKDDGEGEEEPFQLRVRRLDLEDDGEVPS